MNSSAISLSIQDYKGRVFTERAFVSRDAKTGTGWYIFAYAQPNVGSDCYGGNIIKLVARPGVKERRHPHYNCRVQRGWKTKKAAVAALESLVSQYLIRK